MINSKRDLIDRLLLILPKMDDYTTYAHGWTKSSIRAWIREIDTMTREQYTKGKDLIATRMKVVNEIWRQVNGKD